MDYANQRGALAAPAPATIQSVIQTFDSEIDKLSILGDTLNKIGDRLLGPRPPEAVGDASRNEPSPSALLDSLQQRRRTVTNLVARCCDAAQRVENGLG